MTENEQRFLELKLRLALGKLKRNMDQVPLEELQTVYWKPYNTLRKHIKDLVIRYMYEIILDGIDGYILIEDKPSMFYDIERAINHPRFLTEFHQALFEQADLDTVKMLLFRLKKTVQQIVRKYQSKVGKEQMDGTEKQIGKEPAGIIPTAEDG